MDLVPAGSPTLFEAAPGGSPANVAVSAARLGVPVRMLARISNDLFGRRLRAHLADNGVDLSLAVEAREPSSMAVVSLGPDGGAEYDFRIDGTADWQWTASELATVLDGDVVAVHSGSLALTMAPGATALRQLLRHARERATISYDPNVRPLLMGPPEEVRQSVERLLPHVDVVKASAEDVAWLLPGRPVEQVVTDWLDAGGGPGRRDGGDGGDGTAGPSLVAITLGANGVLAAGRQAGIVRRRGRAVQIVDTVGAGDSFTGALLAGLHRRNLLGAERRAALAALPVQPLGELLDEAVLVSALTCTRRGADPPRTAELQTIPS
jgi:fructokinase